MEPVQIAEYVAVPEPLWLDLAEGFLPYLADDEKLADAWVAIGEWLASDRTPTTSQVASHGGDSPQRGIGGQGRAGTSPADHIAIPIRIRTIPDRLRWLALHLADEGEKPGVRLGVAVGLGLIANEMDGAE